MAFRGSDPELRVTVRHCQRGRDRLTVGDGNNRIINILNYEQRALAERARRFDRRNCVERLAEVKHSRRPHHGVEKGRVQVFHLRALTEHLLQVGVGAVCDDCGEDRLLSCRKDRGRRAFRYSQHGDSFVTIAPEFVRRGHRDLALGPAEIGAELWIARAV